MPAILLRPLQQEQQKPKRDAAAKVERQAVNAEMAAVEAKAKKDRDAAAADRTAREKSDEALADKLEADRKTADAAAKSCRAAASAPDRLKVTAFAATVRLLIVPAMVTENGKLIGAELAAKVNGFADWIEGKASDME